MSSKAPTTFQVRAYREEDEAQVLGLLHASLGGGPAGARPPEFFRWKHMASPFGPSFMLVAEAEGMIIGLRAFMRWRFRAGDRELVAVTAVDTATHPRYQGMGVFSTLTREALGALRGEIDLVFNTPNEKSLPGYLKMGWRTVGTIPVWIRPRRPLRFVAGVRSIDATQGPPSAPPPVSVPAAGDVLRDARGVDDLLAAAGSWGGRIATVRDAAYLRWRYGDAPLLDYRAVGEVEAGRLRGLAIFRVRPRGSLWETTVSEVIVPAGERRAARTLLRRVADAAGVDHLACSFPPGTAPARAARRSGYLRSPRGITFVVNPLGDDIRPEPVLLASWALSLGDVEVF